MTQATAHNAWNAFLDHVRAAVSSEEFDLWIRPLELVEQRADALVAEVPNRFFHQWIQDHFRGLFERAQEKIGVVIEFRTANGHIDRPVAMQRGTAAAKPTAKTKAPEPVETNREPHPDLNPRYVFANFVPGSSNQFAHASSLAVSEHPGHRYNPLFIYGGVGLGKTHLLHAIGHALHASGRGWRILYLSSEQFMNEVVNAIRFEKLSELRHRFRSQCDLLLVDDVQFLSGKERTQIEFFHVFNSLYERGKQIVLTSDTVPKEIPALEDRLRSRFESGLIADIQPPEFEHRLAILQRKAADLGLKIDEQVLAFAATYIHSNVRELEGALIRLSAKSSFEGRVIDLDFAKQVLGDLIEVAGPGTSIDRIQKVVSELFHIRVSDLRGKSRKKNIAYPRQISMYLCRELTSFSLPEIGQYFGGKDHTTVLHSIRKIDSLRRQDPELNGLVDSLTRTLTRGG